MRIDNSTYQYIGLGAMLKNNQKATAFNPLLNDRQDRENVSVNDSRLPVRSLGMSPFSSYMSVKSNITNRLEDNWEVMLDKPGEKGNETDELTNTEYIDGLIEESHQHDKYFSEYNSELLHSLHGLTNSEENIENLSNKYDELYKSIIESDMDEDEKNERLESLNCRFEAVLRSVFVNDAFIAKSNQIHDYLVAYISKDIIVNPDKQKHDRIIENNKLTMEYLNNLKAMLKSYANMFYESFMDDIKGGNSVEKSIEAGFSRLREDSSLSMSYDDAKAKAEDLSKKLTEVYKYI